MDAFFSASSASAPYGYGAGGWSYDSLKNFRQITPAVQTRAISISYFFKNIYQSLVSCVPEILLRVACS